MASRIPGFAAVAVGAMFSLVSLETAGFAMLLLIPVGVVLKQGKAARIPLLMVTFATGYLIGIGFIALQTSGILNGGRVDWGVAAYFASLAAIGVVLLIVGTAMGVRAQHRGSRVAT